MEGANRLYVLVYIGWCPTTELWNCILEICPSLTAQSFNIPTSYVVRLSDEFCDSTCEFAAIKAHHSDTTSLSVGTFLVQPFWMDNWCTYMYIYMWIDINLCLQYLAIYWFKIVEEDDQRILLLNVESCQMLLQNFTMVIRTRNLEFVGGPFFVEDLDLLICLSKVVRIRLSNVLPTDGSLAGRMITTGMTWHHSCWYFIVSFHDIVT